MIGTRNRRDKRQRGTGYAGVLRDTRVAGGEDYVVDHSAPRTSDFSWRLVSGAIVVVLSLVLVFFYTSNVFYVRSISVGGLKYLTKEEVFAFADIAEMHVFWINPTQVRESLMRSPSVADAEVWIGWPPQMVNIVLEEREPALVWEQNGTAVWVDIQGRIMAQRQNRDDLMIIQADMNVSEGPLSESGRVNPDIVVGALQIQELRPDVTMLRYDPAKGLGFPNAGGWQVWLGSGAHMQEKMNIYNTLEANLILRGIQPSEINIVDPDYPYYTTMWNQ